MTKLSIITICYNEPDVEKTCESIVNQSWQDFEWIVIDGGSNKETLDIFEKYKNRINTFISEKDNGIYNAMNKGIKLANGEYLNFLNAGDYYKDNDVLKNAINYNLDKDIVYGDIELIKKPINKIRKYPNIIDLNFLYSDSLPHQASFIRKELFLKYGLYNENNKIVSDWEKWIEFILINNCSYKHIDLICGLYNLEGISSTNASLNVVERKTVLEKHFSEKELYRIEKTMKRKYSFKENIFSIKNSVYKNYKIITILGFRLFFKRRT